MNRKLTAALAGTLVLGFASCIYVRVKGDLPEEMFDDEDDGLFHLTHELGDDLVDAEYDLDLDANIWTTEAVWTVRYAEGDADQAFRSAKDAVLRRIAQKGGEVTSSGDPEPRHWTCDFRIDGEPGEASVRQLEDERDSSRPHRIEIRWKESS